MSSVASARKNVNMKTLYEEHSSKTFTKNQYGDTERGCVI